MNIQKIVTLSGALLIGSATLVSIVQAELLFHYDFDSSATTGTLSGKAGIGADGTGVTGQPGDHALDNTASTMSGSGGGVYYEGALGTLKSFTITLWFKTDGSQQAKGATRLFDNGIQLLGFDGADTAASQKLTFNSGSTVLQINDSALAAKGEWMFVALSYNGNETLNNVSLYVGTKGGVELASQTGSSSLGAIDWGSSATAKLMFGANTGNGRSLDGWLDNIKFYGSTTGVSGALDSTAIANIWKTDMTPIPESSTWSMLLGGCALIVVILRRRRMFNFSR